SGVWVLDQSRLERNPRIWHLFVYVVTENKVKYYPAGVETDLDDPVTEMVTGVMSLTNKLFAKLTGKKVKDSLELNISKGKYHGMTAYGYRKDIDSKLCIDETQSEVVKRIFKLSLEGIGTYTIANILNSENIPTKYNAFEGVLKKKDRYTKEITPFNKKDVKWRGNVVYDIITNTIYKGKLKWGNEYFDAPAILTSEYWQEVNDNLERNKKKVGKREEYKYLLNGLIICENCGKPMRGKKREKGSDSAYKCGGGMNCRGMSIEKLETFIIKHLFQSKTLKEILNQSPATGNEILEDLKSKIERKKGEFKSVSKLLNRLTMIDQDDEIEADDDFMAKYKETRLRKKKLQDDIANLEKELDESDSNFAINHYNNIVDGFTIKQGFDIVKASIHSLIQSIRIGYFKQEKGGYFILRLEYKRFGDVSLFTTNHQLFKWIWAEHHRDGFTNKDDEAQDKELFEYLHGEEAPADFAGFESVSVMAGEQVVLSKDELISFN
ncbi:MAG: hypothetical protein DCE86_17565, partial [Flavobacteriaceae bacterium]